MKHGPKIFKNEHFQKKKQKKKICSFYVTLSLPDKKLSCRSNEVACGQNKDKEGKIDQKWKKQIPNGHERMATESHWRKMMG